MKILQKQIKVNQPGSVKIQPEEPDDLWLAYTLIAPGDTIVADTTRKVNLGKGAKECTRVKINLEIKITTVDYEKDSSVLRIRGKNMLSNDYVASGVFHTLEIEKNKQFELRKMIWDSNCIDILKESCDKGSGADLAVILLKQGCAGLFLIGNKTTTLCSKIQYEKNLFGTVFQAFRKHVDLNSIRCAIIAGSGSIKDEFRSYLIQESQKLKIKSIEKYKSRIVVIGMGKSCNLKDVLEDERVMCLIKHTKAASEIRAFKEFSEILTADSDRACYGSQNVETAQEMMAIETLLITDEMLRNKEIVLRQKYLGLVKSVKAAGGKAFVFSSTHVSCEALTQLTGIAAVLRFPLPDLDDLVL